MTTADACQTVHENFDWTPRNLASNHTIVEDAHVQPSGLIFGGSDLRGLRANVAVLVHLGKCGWRAAHASMAQEMPRSS